MLRSATPAAPAAPATPAKLATDPRVLQSCVAAAVTGGGTGAVWWPRCVTGWKCICMLYIWKNSSMPIHDGGMGWDGMGWGGMGWDGVG